ncbi:hypothetical protein H5410_000034 [Solanum commersonii]|uniref:AtC3H46-like PABC-like domain-containing protein n=1 Tax=Solanum commersonii TaxID=4109 RepID=A0A9J6AUS2_SOLCO|nr:hypothetical protein H5410_000034 [Solanum commersonii]
MDSYESTKTVLSRIQSWDPENASKIKGYLLKQNQGDEEMIRLGLLSNCSSAPSTPPFSSVSNANKFNPFPQSSPRIMIPNNGFHSSPPSSPWSGGHCREFAAASQLMASGDAEPPVSSISLLVSTQLVFTVGLGERHRLVYSMKAAVFLNIGVGIFDIGKGNDICQQENQWMRK